MQQKKKKSNKKNQGLGKNGSQRSFRAELVSEREKCRVEITEKPRGGGASKHIQKGLGLQSGAKKRLSEGKSSIAVVVLMGEVLLGSDLTVIIGQGIDRYRGVSCKNGKEGWGGGAINGGQ